LIKGSSLGDEGALVEERLREVKGHESQGGFLAWRERVSIAKRRHTSLGGLECIPR
jgi:hypothetical protein